MQPVNDLHFTASEVEKAQLRLTSAKIRALERSKVVTPIEKARLLAILYSRRWLTEIKLDVRNPNHLPELTNLLDKLRLAWTIDSYIKKDGTRIEWVEVASNKAIVKYLSANRSRLSVIEAGLLYGYPATAILGCAGLIKMKHKNTRSKTAAERCFGGLYSEKSQAEEARYCCQLWTDLEVVSPIIFRQVEEYYRQLD